MQGEPIPLTKLPEPNDCGPCRLIQFYQMKEKQFCAVVSKKNEIHLFEMEETGPDIIQTIKPIETGSERIPIVK